MGVLINARRGVDGWENITIRAIIAQGTNEVHGDKVLAFAWGADWGADSGWQVNNTVKHYYPYAHLFCYSNLINYLSISTFLR